MQLQLSKSLAHRSINGLLSLVGLEIGRKGSVSRLSPRDALSRVRALGVSPKTVIDVGAAYGDWSATCSRIFPAARYFLVEPLHEFADFLNSRLRQLGNAHYVPAAVTKAVGVVTIHVHPDLVGSSLLQETEGHGVDGFEREVPAITVDELVRRYEAPGPYLLKLDVQGAELDVLAGAIETIKNTDLVILEVSFFRFFQNGSQFHDVVLFMNGIGFVVYDIFNLVYRPADGALAQADVMFVPDDSPLRSYHAYVRPEQRNAQNRLFLKTYIRRRKKAF